MEGKKNTVTMQKLTKDNGKLPGLHYHCLENQKLFQDNKIEKL